MAHEPSSPGGLSRVKTVEEVQAMIHKSFELPKVKFLRQRMAEAGCPVKDNFFKAVVCHGRSGAGFFSPGQGCLYNLFLTRPTTIQLRIKIPIKSLPLVTELLHTQCRIQSPRHLHKRSNHSTNSSWLHMFVCSNHATFQDEVNQLVIHELIHAYDDCRARNLNWMNCAHQACSEIRAGHLSGDCHFMRELLRGHFKLRGHEQECIRRRVLLSLFSNPRCVGSIAKNSMEDVWDTCYNDTQPFDKAP